MFKKGKDIGICNLYEQALFYYCYLGRFDHN